MLASLGSAGAVRALPAFVPYPPEHRSRIDAVFAESGVEVASSTANTVAWQVTHTPPGEQHAWESSLRDRLWHPHQHHRFGDDDFTLTADLARAIAFDKGAARDV